MERLDAEALRRWARAAASDLGAARARIDAVNVFPVPDSDTGTNVYLTVANGSRLVAWTPSEAGAGEVAAAFARGALIGARGNSGVILSQYLDGIARSIGHSASLDAGHLADALDAAQAAARTAVARPVEGTVLTAATAAAVAARSAAEGGADLGATMREAVAGASRAVSSSRNDLPVLRAAGVVDAGAWALVVLLAALLGVLDGTGSGPDGTGGGSPDGRPDRTLDGEGPGATGDHRSAPTSWGAGDPGAAAGGEFEVMFLVETIPGARGEGPDLDPGAVLPRRMEELGDSVAVVGGHGVWQVHVHTDTPDLAVAAGTFTHGTPPRPATTQRQVTVRCLPPQLPGAARVATGPGSSSGVGFVVGTRSPRLVADLARTGAVVHVLTEQVPSAGELLRAIVDTGCREVVVLPGDLAAVEVAVEAAGLAADESSAAPARVHVLPATDDLLVVTGLAAAVESRAGADVASLLAAVDAAVRSTCTVTVDGADASSASEAVGALLDEVGAPGDQAGITVVVTILTGADVLDTTTTEVVGIVNGRYPGIEPVVLEAGFRQTAWLIGAQRVEVAPSAAGLGPGQRPAPRDVGAE